MGFADLANVSNRNNRNLQRTPERHYWTKDRLDKRDGTEIRTPNTDLAPSRRARVCRAVFAWLPPGPQPLDVPAPGRSQANTARAPSRRAIMRASAEPCLPGSRQVHSRIDIEAQVCGRESRALCLLL